MTAETVSEPANPAEAPAPQASGDKPHRSSKGPLLSVLALIVLGSGAWVSYPLWGAKLGLPLAMAPDAIETDTLRAELSAATARIAQLEARSAVAPAAVDTARLDRLEDALKSAQASGNAAAIPSAELDALTKQIADLKRNTAEASAVLRLAERLDKVEAALRDMQAKHASATALLLAAGQLREAVAAGRPYDSEWRAAQVVAGEDKESLGLLDGLKDKAATGIVPRAALIQRFDALAPALIRAEILPEGDGWWKATADRLLSLVTIRREDGAALGHNTAAIVGRAQAAVSRDDLDAALAELDSLSPGPAEAAAPWVAEAKARLAADLSLSRLTAQAVALAGNSVRVGP